MDRSFVKKKIELAYNLFDKNDFKSAFVIYEDIAYDINNDLINRADAYLMMGLIIECFDPGLSNTDDESGLEYYKLGLELIPDHKWLLIGIIRSFGDYFPYHTDIIEFKKAYNILLNNQFDDDILQMIKRKYALMQKMEQEQKTKDDTKGS